MSESRHAYKEIQVLCTCEHTFVTRSTYAKSQVLKTEICGMCHPFYTGQKKSMDTDKRIDTFYGKYAKFSKNTQSAQK
jgi:large subunit ribosomal protein L31